MQDANLKVINAEIISQRHLDLTVEKFFLKSIYDANEISYYVYEQIKNEIDKEIFQIIKKFKEINKQKNTIKQIHNVQEDVKNDA